MLFVACLASMIGAYVLFKFKKKLLGFIASVLCVALLSLYAVNYLSERRDITLSEKTLDQIISINWLDNEELQSLGFKKNNDDDFIAYRTVNGKEYKIEFTLDSYIPNDTFKYENVSYSAEELKMGNFDIRRLWTDKIPVSREYSFYFKDKAKVKKLVIYEDCYDGEEVMVDEIVDALTKPTPKKKVKD